MQQFPSSRYIGRKAFPCRKCKGSSHYVNRLGGIVCESCNPPKNAEADLASLLTISSGVGIDPANRFDLIEPQPSAIPSATSPSHGAGRVAAGVTIGSHSGPRSPKATVSDLAWGRGPSGEFSQSELDLFGLESIWAAGASSDVTLVNGRLKPKSIGIKNGT